MVNLAASSIPGQQAGRPQGKQGAALFLMVPPEFTADEILAQAVSQVLCSLMRMSEDAVGQLRSNRECEPNQSSRSSSPLGLGWRKPVTIRGSECSQAVRCEKQWLATFSGVIVLQRFYTWLTFERACALGFGYLSLGSCKSFRIRTWA
jgi:hypothetical protein